jgi:3-oxoacyl-[acyl-carrier-protein] synthase III
MSGFFFFSFVPRGLGMMTRAVKQMLRRAKTAASAAATFVLGQAARSTLSRLTQNRSD